MNLGVIHVLSGLSGVHLNSLKRPAQLQNGSQHPTGAGFATLCAGMPALLNTMHMQRDGEQD